MLKNGSPNKPYTRYNFLLFDAPTIKSGGNDALHARLKLHYEQNPDSEPEWESENWNEWKSYPNFSMYSYENLTAGDALEFMAWLVHTFAGSVSCSGAKDDTYEVRFADKGLDFMTTDDLAFIFVQLEHNISMWNMLERAYREKIIVNDEKKFTEEEKKVFALIKEHGYEFPKTGSGVSGKFGQRRYIGITKFFHFAYWQKDKATDEYLPSVAANRKALSDRLSELIEADRETAAAAADVPGTATKNSASKKPQAKELPQDPILESIWADAWSDVPEIVTV